MQCAPLVTTYRKKSFLRQLTWQLRGLEVSEGLGALCSAGRAASYLDFPLRQSRRGVHCHARSPAGGGERVRGPDAPMRLARSVTRGPGCSLARCHTARRAARLSLSSLAYILGKTLPTDKTKVTLQSPRFVYAGNQA